MTTSTKTAAAKNTLPEIDLTGKDKSASLEALIRAGYSFSEAETYFKAKKGRKGYVSEFLALLRKERLSDAAFESFFAGLSANARSNIEYYRTIKDLANGIRDDLEGEKKSTS